MGRFRWPSARTCPPLASGFKVVHRLYQRHNWALQRKYSTPYQTLFDNNTIAGQALNVPPGLGVALPAAKFGCELGVVNTKWFIGAAERLLRGLAANKMIGPSTFPLVVLDSVLSCDNMPAGAEDPGFIRQHCLLGYHSAYNVNPQHVSPIQTYAEAVFDTSGTFKGTAPDVDVLSHEAGEGMDHPITTDTPTGGHEGDVGGNASPAWGGFGQVPQGSFRADVEVGDPLSILGQNSTEFEVPLNNFNYDLQELAFFSWFFGGPSIGANGWFSDDESFKTNTGAVCK
jgi:hypothetical protein